MGSEEHNNGYIIEYVSIGGSVKVTAFDPKTLIEATVIAPASLTPKEQSDLAVRKLHYLLEKKKNKS